MQIDIQALCIVILQHLNLQQMVTSIVLVAVVTVEVDNVSKLLPFFVPMPKKDAMCAVTALKEALLMCDNRNLHQIKGSRVPASRQMEVVNSPTRRFKIYVGRRILFYLTLQPISHPRMA